MGENFTCLARGQLRQHLRYDDDDFNSVFLSDAVSAEALYYFHKHEKGPLLVTK